MNERADLTLQQVQALFELQDAVDGLVAVYETWRHGHAAGCMDVQVRRLVAARQRVRAAFGEASA